MKREKVVAAGRGVFFIFIVLAYIIMAAMPGTPPEGLDRIRQQIKEESLIQ